ncbi:MAG: transposase [Muribaculaceae bacterium]|nr:transposase [Muribaculaceae bacterium]
MKKETYEAQKNFAGEKKPSMLRRCVGHDYTARQIYMITMVTEGRRPLFGKVVGKSSAHQGSPEEPHIELSDLGKRVSDEWWLASQHHPEIEVISLQMMPDHLHGILFVKEKMEKPLGMALRGFKQSCNRHYRELVLGQPHLSSSCPSTVQSVALATQQTQQAGHPQKDRHGEDRTHGLLFARGYNDKLLLRAGQLETWRQYLADNPRRLLMKREHPDLFRVQRNVIAAGLTFTAIGNQFLLNRPFRLQVQCSRKLTEQEIQIKIAEYLKAAQQGAVLVSPAISPGEKAIMRAAFDMGMPLIYLQENGFSDLAKPSGACMLACSRGQLLLLAPWGHHNEQINISRGQCLSLNEMARSICT